MINTTSNTINNRFGGISNRDGRGMKGRVVSGTTKTTRNGIIINPITAPPMKELVDLIGFWGWQAKSFISEVCGLWTTKTINNAHRRWFKYNSYLRTLRRLRVRIIWTFQTNCTNYVWQAEQAKGS